MAEIEKAIVEESTPTETEEVTVEIDEGKDETSFEEVIETSENFFANLAEDMDERTLSRMASQLIEEFKRDKDDTSKTKVNPSDKKKTNLNQIAIREVE